MTDFQDFLKHKLAYVARVEFKPGQFATAKQLFDILAVLSDGDS